MLRFALLTLGVCQAWQHLLSFNDQCTAELSAFRGTQLEISMTAGRLPYQFKYAMEQVIKSRVASEGCSVTDAQESLFFGTNILNVLQFLDSSDTTLATASLPVGCNNTLDFNWKQAKSTFDGIVLPSSCTAKGYASSKLCQAKFKLVDNLYIELRIEEVCNSEAQTGYGLPSFNLFCSGSLCNSFAKPCASNTDCSGGATCDTVKGSSLVDALQPLIDMGLFVNATDGSCNGGGKTFQEKFWSGIMNSAAYLTGLTSSVSTAVYSDVKLCGIAPLQTKYIPTDSPTPVPMFRCQDGFNLPLSQVCDGTKHCTYGEDEQYCRCGVGKLDSGYYRNNETQCCPVCPTSDDSKDYYCTNYYCARQSSYEGKSILNIEAACPKTADGTPTSCPDLIFASTTALPQFTKKVLGSISAASTSQHIMGWADCNGNIQIGSPAELAQINAHVPFQAITGELERVLKSLETCRAGTAATGSAWARQFFPWAANMWGGIFFSDAAAQGIFNDVNPAALIDKSLRYYDYADSRGDDGAYHVNAPFKNVDNAPTTCNLASTTGITASCAVAANIGSWFEGSSFPAGWNGATTVKFNVASTCTTSSLPSAFFTCEGACDANAKSGCCILRNALVSQSVPGKCPPGYALTPMDGSGVTDFLLKNYRNSSSKDTTLQNWVQLISARAIKFGSGATFIDPTGNQDSRSFCLINGSSFGDNTDKWAKSAVTQDCADGSEGCPRFLAGGAVQACTTCAAPPTPAGGGGGGTTANPASLVAPVFGLVASLGVVALF